VLRALVFLVGLGLSLYALIDCIQTEDDDVRGLPKIGWIALIVLVTIVGPLAWLIAGKDRTQPGRSRRRGPVAPDDDPEFLRSLELRRRQAEDDLRRREGGTSADGSDGSAH
jgi:hypothetical protein